MLQGSELQGSCDRCDLGHSRARSSGISVEFEEESHRLEAEYILVRYWIANGLGSVRWQVSYEKGLPTCAIATREFFGFTLVSCGCNGWQFGLVLLCALCSFAMTLDLGIQELGLIIRKIQNLAQRIHSLFMATPAPC